VSGKPNYTEITALLLNMQRANALGDSIQRRQRVIESETAAQKAEIEERGDLLQKCKALIEGMDVRSEGNYGFEGRYHWFLLELVRQAEQSGRMNP
jgi:hypothetical protein